MCGWWLGSVGCQVVGGVSIGMHGRGRDQVGALTAALGQAFSHGVGVDWSAFLPAGPVVDLQTYAFQHQRYWPEVRTSSGNASGLGLSGVDHPLLGAAVSVADSGECLFTGRISVRT